MRSGRGWSSPRWRRFQARWAVAACGRLRVTHRPSRLVSDVVIDSTTRPGGRITGPNGWSSLQIDIAIIQARCSSSVTRNESGSRSEEALPCPFVAMAALRRSGRRLGGRGVGCRQVVPGGVRRAVVAGHWTATLPPEEWCGGSVAVGPKERIGPAKTDRPDALLACEHGEAVSTSRRSALRCGDGGGHGARRGPPAPSADWRSPSVASRLSGHGSLARPPARVRAPAAMASGNGRRSGPIVAQAR